MVILVRALLLTSCFIPFSGMENSLYRGEGVLVSKLSYGLRMPFPSWLGYYRWGEMKVQRGDIVVFNNPMPHEAQQLLEHREVYISRCIALPGDTMRLNCELVSDDEVFSPDSKSLYTYPSQQEDRMLSVLEGLGIRDNMLTGFTVDGKYIRRFSNYEYYLLTQRIGQDFDIVPLSNRLPKKSNLFVVPSKGKQVSITPWNIKLMCNTIACHENKSAIVKNDTLYVDGQYMKEYTFTRDYYWMRANDPMNLNDSRLFGFVPDSHIIGKAVRIWYPSERSRFMKKVE